MWAVAVLLVFGLAWVTSVLAARTLYRRGRINAWVFGGVAAVAIALMPLAAATAGRVELPMDIWFLMGLLPALAALVAVPAALKRQRR